jgi:DNA-binding transcriptional ArsR family regulator
MARQLNIYNWVSEVPTLEEISFGVIISPKEIMNEFGVSQRMLQRDLKDLRDCGLVNVKYNKARDMYFRSNECIFDESAEGRHLQHLRRLYRLGTLISKLPRVYQSEIDHYETLVQELNDYIEFSQEDPKTFPPEDIDEMRENAESEYPYFPNLKSEYYKLFPDSNERTRQRDFKELRDAGFEILYSKNYSAYMFIFDDRI